MQLQKTKRVVLLSDIVDFPSHFDKKFNFRSMNTSPTLLNGDEFEFDSSCCSSVMSPASFQTSSEVASILNQPIKNIELTENPYNEELKGILTRRNHPDLPTP
ncbi:hypothetical protein QTN25_008261 [Entamoeba marina]